MILQELSPEAIALQLSTTHLIVDVLVPVIVGVLSGLFFFARGRTVEIDKSRILFRLQRTQDRTGRALAEELGIPRGRVYRLLHELCEEGHARSHPSGDVQVFNAVYPARPLRWDP